jgi:hypothetical protein
MDFALLIPIIALSIPVVAIIVGGINKRAKWRLEEAQLRMGGGIDTEELDELRADLDQVRAELGEMHERLDFTERLLTQSRDRGELPPA